MLHVLHIYAALFVAVLTSQCEAAIATNIGINYGQVANNLPSATQVVRLINSTTIRKVKLYDSNPVILTAFANSHMEFIIGVTNEEIPSLLDEQAALKWASENVAPYMRSSPVTVVAVGNQVLTDTNVSSSVHTQLVTVMQNLRAALIELRLDNRVLVSTPHCMSILNTSFPPSDGEFRSDLVKPVLLPLLRFLNQTGAPLMVNVYPYYSYKAKPMDVSLAYALFESNKGVTDPKTRLHYDNLFDAQVDAVYTAMEKLGFTSVPVLVSETGWPSEGSPVELGASVSNAMTYNRNLVRHVQSGVGTPMRPKQTPTVFIFALFNENKKPGPTTQRNFGIFRPSDLSTVYDIGVLQGGQSGQSPPPPLTIPIPRPPSPLRYPPPPPLTIPVPRPPAAGRPPPPLVFPILRPPTAHPPPSRSSPPPPPSRPSPPPSRSSPPPPIAMCLPTPNPPPPRVIPPIHPPPTFTRPPYAPVISYPPPTVYRPPYAPVISYPPPTVYTPPTAPPTVYTPPPTVYTPPLPPTCCEYAPPPPPASSSQPCCGHEPPPPASGSQPCCGQEPPPPASGGGGGGGGGGGHVWCVAKPGGDASKMMAGLNYACGEGGADCTAIQPGGSCFEPNNVDSHASYAFNSYYQKHGRNYWNCYFDGNALVTVSDPSSGSCIYPSQ